LQRTGRIAANGLWIDGIKSVCIVQFETDEQAEETRMALHGITWPNSNPKTLNVDFTTKEKLKQRHASGVEEQVEQPSPRKPAGRQMVREWDRVKMGEKSPGEKERERERWHKEREEEKQRDMEKKEKRQRREQSEQRPPPKSLDDLFRKTTVKPCLYWLPLKKEQIAVREEARRVMLQEQKKKAEIESKRKAEEQERLDRLEKKRIEERNKREEERNNKREEERRNRRRSRSRSARRSPVRRSRERRRRS